MRFWLLVIFSVVVLAGLSARELGWKYVRPMFCHELTLPADITMPGCYYLASDFASSDPSSPGLQVMADDVSVELDDKSLRGTGPDNTASGIYAVGVDNFELSGGTIEGFLFGVRVLSSAETPSGGVRIEGTKIANGGARGIAIAGENVTIVGNTVSNLEGYSGWPASHTIGVEVHATNCRIEGNQITNIYPYSVGEVVAISLSAPSQRCSVRENTIVNQREPRVGRGIAFWLTTGHNDEAPMAVEVTANHVQGYAYALMGASQRLASFRGNKFEVGCLPEDVTTYGPAADLNEFVSDDFGCTDTVQYLTAKAASRDPEWTIRLAAALLEGQWSPLNLEERCQNLADATLLLRDLVAEKMQAALDQQRRIDSGAGQCAAN